MLDSARYWLGMLTLMSLPWALLFWWLVHPLIGFWRRVGPAATYTALILIGVAMGWTAWSWRHRLMAGDYGTGPLLWVVAAVLYAGAIAVELQCRKHLKWRTLIGIPELSPDPAGGQLLEQGIYAHIRHPRYLSVILGMLAAAFFCNYVSVWITVALSVPALYGIVMLEERELRDRFGDAYIDYCTRVPRFVPASFRN